MNKSRRIFLKLLVAILTGVGITRLCTTVFRSIDTGNVNPSIPTGTKSKVDVRLGVDADGLSRVYLVRNATPEENMAKMLELMGGIEKYIGREDIVILKPNAQRYNQGMTNTDAMKGFIDAILAIPDFSGEIIIGENNQFQDKKRGWNAEQRNGRFNLYELVQYYQERGCKNVTKYEWHNAGPVSSPLQADGCCGTRTTGPEQGDGYVWLDDCYYVSPAGRKCLMTYPVFTSSYSGACIDLKNGAWKDGAYTTKPVKLVNFSALNHHSRYAGATASVKNLMGIVDMSCGFHGDTPHGTYNVHHIGVSERIRWLDIHWRIRAYGGKMKDMFEDFCHRNFHHAGGALGYLMTHVRFPDLNIITADLVGWGSRTDMGKAFKPRALLASRDPVALDYVAAKMILYPGTPPEAIEESGIKYAYLNNPDSPEGPFAKFLSEAHNQGVGNLDPQKIQILSQTL